MIVKTLIFAILAVNLVRSTEFVPVFMWGTLKTTEEHVPALHKTSEDSFKDTILELLKKKPKIIIFAENTLSPEDFAQRDQNGRSAFPHLLKQQQEGLVTYRPHVQNAIEAIKQLNSEITQIPISDVLDDLNVPKGDILIIDLNDAEDDEHRITMLKRHDSAINAVYNRILDESDNVLAIYTAYHTSWVAPEEVRRMSRSLLEEKDTEADGDGDGDDVDKAVVYKFSNFSLMYLSEPGLYISKNKNATLDKSFKPKVEQDDTSMTLTLTKGPLQLTLSIVTDASQYWILTSAKTTGDIVDEMVIANVYALNRFSYHCGNFKIVGKHGIWHLPGFQIQPFFESQANSDTLKFDDAFDCVGFTTVPIWSGLFVTLIFLLIMTFGLTMMMDIKTMDRFDDPKGKTITINAAE